MARVTRTTSRARRSIVVGLVVASFVVSCANDDEVGATSSAAVASSERTPSTRRTVLIIGDSLAAGFVRTDALRQRLGEQASARSMTTTVNGLSGAGWVAAGDGDPPFADEFRRVASLPEDVVVVIVLGANDALLAALAPTATKSSWRARSDDAIAAAVRQVAGSGRCLVLTTPPDLAINNFGTREDFATESRRVGEVLRKHAVDAPNIALGDFAALSRTHHRADGDPDDWFSGDDELHPNSVGTEAFQTLVLDAVDRCPPR